MLVFFFEKDVEWIVVCLEDFFLKWVDVVNGKLEWCIIKGVLYDVNEKEV